MLSVEIGSVFGNLKVISGLALYSKWGTNVSMQVCVCVCGAEKPIRPYDLIHGVYKSCGCLSPKFRPKNGALMEGRLYDIWRNMRKRCRQKQLPGYKYYGGKGITICNEWETFEGFSEWASSAGYSDNLTIERKEADKNYCPDNCEWITKAENCRRSAVARWARVRAEREHSCQ